MSQPPPGHRHRPVKPPPNHGPVIVLTILTCGIGAFCFWLLLSETPEPQATDVVAETTESTAPTPASSAVRETSRPATEPVVRKTSQPDAPLSSNDLPELVQPTSLPPEDPSDTRLPEPEVTEYNTADTGPFSDEEPLLLLGLQATSTASRERDAALLAKATEENAWSSYHDLLTTSLERALRTSADDMHRRGFDVLWQEAVFVQAFLRWRVLEMMPLQTIRTSERDASPLLGWIMTQNEVMQEWLVTVKAEDDLPRVVEILYDLWYGDPEQFEKYVTLALACAVVFDRELRVQHPPQSAGYNAQVTIDPLERFLWFAEKNEANRLAAPVHRMPARDLVWVVCAPVATEELEWAISNMRLRRSRWGQAFGMVEYLMERAVNGENPYEEYTFAEILKHGGICGDQSYFCANTARAHGIPAMILSGETDLGPHAWVALQTNPPEWTTLIGRIGGVSNGESHNPQTRTRISEQEVWLWNEREYRDTATLTAVFRYHWLADILSRTIGDEKLVESAIRQANSRGRNVPETWARLHQLLAFKTRQAENPGDRAIVDMWTRFVSEMKAQFRDNPRMGTLAASAEDEFIFPHIEEGEARRILLRERRRLERNADEQTDLIATSLKREADLIAANGGDDALTNIRRLYSSALRNHGDSITGFRMMAEDYFAFVKDSPDHADHAVRDIELAFNRVIASGTTEWFRANTEVSIFRMIVGYYRQIGNESRATTLERRLERQMRRAERGATR